MVIFHSCHSYDVMLVYRRVSLKHDNPADRPTQTPCHSFFSFASVGLRSPDPGGFSLNSEVMAPPPSLYACAGCTRWLTEVTLPHLRRQKCHQPGFGRPSSISSPSFRSLDPPQPFRSDFKGFRGWGIKDFRDIPGLVN